MVHFFSGDLLTRVSLDSDSVVGEYCTWLLWIYIPWQLVYHTLTSTAWYNKTVTLRYNHLKVKYDWPFVIIQSNDKKSNFCYISFLNQISVTYISGKSFAARIGCGLKNMKGWIPKAETGELVEAKELNHPRRTQPSPNRETPRVLAVQTEFWVDSEVNCGSQSDSSETTGRQTYTHLSHTSQANYTPTGLPPRFLFLLSCIQEPKPVISSRDHDDNMYKQNTSIWTNWPLSSI